MCKKFHKAGSLGCNFLRVRVLTTPWNLLSHHYIKCLISVLSSRLFFYLDFDRFFLFHDFYPYCWQIDSVSKCKPWILKGLLSLFMFFHHFWWLEIHPHPRKNWINHAFQLSISFWDKINLNISGLCKCWHLQNRIFFLIKKVCQHES